MKNKNNISFEFYPPKTPDGIIQLQATANQLAKISPKYFSVTYGAGGSTQNNTHETVLEIQRTTNIETAPHISCISSTQNQINRQLQQYKQYGIEHLVALRGDLPSGMGSCLGEFKYAKDLVRYIREQTGDYFTIEVAVYPEFHPECLVPSESLKHFQQKVLAGANSAITQYFYNPDAYFYLLDACQKLNINIPIIPGIMPITNYKQLMRFSNLCGAEIPRWIKLRLENYGDDLEAIRLFGEEIVTTMCQKLLAHGAPGLHFYTLNKSQASLAILNNLKITNVV